MGTGGGWTQEGTGEPGTLGSGTSGTLRSSEIGEEVRGKDVILWGVGLVR